MRLRYSALALAELDEILAYIAARNPSAAARVQRRVQRTCETIARFPEGAQEVAQRPSVRRAPLVRYPYVIYYTIEAGEVLILRIIHGARRRPW